MATAARDIVPDRTAASRPALTQTANGLDQVDIAPPSPAGVSLNAYQRFDVSRAGAILNNSSGIVATRQAGYIRGNPNLRQAGSARIIVNQVTGTAASALRGHLEVAGPRSEVVVANPNGIVVDGAGFLNVSRATLTTGRAQVAEGGRLHGWCVRGGKVQVEGDGLHAGETDQLDLLARAVSSNAAIHAQRLHAIAGANQVDHVSLASRPVEGEGVAPALAIDIGRFGGLHAGSIRLAATERGAGVSHHGLLAAQSGDLTLTAEGRLMLAGATQAAGDLRVATIDSIEHSGALHALGSATIDAAGRVSNAGQLAAQRDLTLNAGEIRSTGTLAAGLTADGVATDAGELTVTAAGALRAVGAHVAGGGAVLKGADVSLAGSSTSARRDLRIAALEGDVNLAQGAASAGGAMAIEARGALRNDGADLRSQGDITLQAASLHNAGGKVLAEGNAQFRAAGAFDNAGGAVHAAGALSVSAADVDNREGRLAAGLLGIIAGGNLRNAGGQLAQHLDGDSRIAVGGRLDNAGGTLATNAGTLLVEAGSLGNDGGTIAHAGNGDLSVSGAGMLDNAGGSIRSNGALLAHGAAVDNRGGKLQAQRSLRLHSDTVIDNSRGEVQSRGDLAIHAGNHLINRGGALSANAGNTTVTIAAAGLDNHDGAVRNAGDGTIMVALAGELANNAGLIAGNGDVDVKAHAVVNANDGAVAAAHRLALRTTGTLDNRHGSLYGSTGLSLQADAVIDNEGGHAETMGDLTVAAGQALHNGGGTLTVNGGHGRMAVDAARLDNRGGRIVNAGSGDSALVADIVSNAGGVIGGNGDTSLTAGDLHNSEGGNLTSAGKLALRLGRHADNRGGALYGGRALVLTGPDATLANQGGRVLAGGDLHGRLARIGQEGGVLRANRDIRIDGGLDGSGEMTAGRDLMLHLDGDYRNAARNRLQADRNLAIHALGTVTNNGTLAAGVALDLRGDNVINDVDGLMTGSEAQVSAADRLHNAGRIDGDTVRLRARMLENTGTMIGGGVEVAGDALSNRGAAALIAASRDVRIHAADSVDNVDGAWIFSAGGLRIARDDTRDDEGMLARQTRDVLNRSAVIEADGDIDIAAAMVRNLRSGIVIEAGVPTTTARTLTAWTAGLPDFELAGHTSLTVPHWRWRPTTATMSAAMIDALRKPVTIEVPEADVSQIDRDKRTLSFRRVPVETYRDRSGTTCTDGYCPPSNAVLSRPLTRNARQYYESIEESGGHYRLTFWPDFDPAVHIRPDQVRVRHDLGVDNHDYSEIRRDTVTTRVTERLVGAGDAAMMRAGGAIRIQSDDGAILNQSSTMTAGGDLVRRAIGGSVSDLGTALQAHASTTDTSTFYWHQKAGGRSDTRLVPYPAAPAPSSMVSALPAIASSNQAVRTVAHDIGVTTVDRFGSTVTGGTIQGGQLVAMPVAGASGAGDAVGAVSGHAQRTQAAGSAQGGIPAPALPRHGLFRLQPAPEARYLVATDPRFTDYRTFLSSDYMLAALGLDPPRIQKRLGDGFHEARTVRDQITRLTGRTLLGSHADPLDEYKALMDQGIAYARAVGLTPGIGLSQEQMRALTTDLVWLVEQEVTLPDGSRQSVLAPTVYLARAPALDLPGAGALVNGQTVSLQASGEVRNSGRVVGDIATEVLGANILNRGAIGGAQGRTSVRAAVDVVNQGGQISGDDVLVAAARDIVLQTPTVTATHTLPNGYTASATIVAPASAIRSAGSAAVLAGRDIRLRGASLQAGDHAVLAAGRDLDVGAVSVGTSQHAVSRGGQSYGHDVVIGAEGSRIETGGSLIAAAGRDVTVTGSSVQAGKDVALLAGASATITAVKGSHRHTEGSLGGRQAQRTRASYDETVQGSDIRAGRDVTLGAGQGAVTSAILQASGVAPAGGGAEGAGHGDLALLGSTVTTGDGGMARLMASADVTIGAVMQTHESADWSAHRRGGPTNRQRSRRDSSGQSATGVGATIAAGAVSARAGRDLTVSGSDVVGTGTVVLTAGRDLALDAVRNTAASHHAERTRKSGILANGGGTISLGTQGSAGQQQAQYTTHTGSRVGSVQGDVRVDAGRDYRQTASHVKALDGDIDITASRIRIEAALDTSRLDQEAHFRQSGLTIGVSNPVISAAQATAQWMHAQGHANDDRVRALGLGAAGLAVKAAADTVRADPASAGGMTLSLAVGSARQDSKAHREAANVAPSSVQAGGDLRIRAAGEGRDSGIAIVGSDLSAARDLALQADGSIAVLAAANTAARQSSQRSRAAGAAVALRGGATGLGIGGSANAAASRTAADGSDVTWSNSHLHAGRALQLESGGDAVLRGALASGEQVAAHVGGDLHIESLQDTSRYRYKGRSSGATVSVGAGIPGAVHGGRQRIEASHASVGERSGIDAGSQGFRIEVDGGTHLIGAAIASTDDAVQAGANRFRTGGELVVQDVENRSAQDASGFQATLGGMSGAGAVATSGRATSTTRAGIAGIAGEVDVRTGTSHDSGLARTFDAEAAHRDLDASIRIASSFAQQASRALDRYVDDSRRELKEQYKHAESEDARAEAADKLDALRRQEQVMHVLIGAVTGAGAGAVAKEGLSMAAGKMRDLMVADSARFPGVTDGVSTFHNLSGDSEGVRGDGYKLGGTRWDLDKLCGANNERCVVQRDSNQAPILDRDGRTQLARNARGEVQFDPTAAGMSLDAFLNSEQGRALAGITGGIQGAKGTLFGIPYASGSWQDQLIEAFAGTHDMIGGKLAGLYDGEGNAVRGRPPHVARAMDAWSATGAIVASSPFAMAEYLPAQVWNAIALLLKAAR